MVSDIALGFLNWIHLIATVAWIGGLFANLLVFMPSATKALGPGPMLGKLFGTVMGRFRPMVYRSMAALAITGLIMMFMNRHYMGLGIIENPWSIAILAKHIVSIIMLIVVLYGFEVLTPKVGRLAAQVLASGPPAGGPPPELIRLQKRQVRVALLGFIFALLILLLTGLATAFSALP